MNDTKARPRPGKTAKYVLLGVLLCAAVGLVCFFAGQAAVRNSEKNASLDAVVVESRLA